MILARKSFSNQIKEIMNVLEVNPITPLSNWQRRYWLLTMSKLSDIDLTVIA
jgi:hypothetical protein